jgi:glycosyltransferase involved in cell wall biosynthesis
MSKKKILVITTTFPRYKNDAIPNFIYELSREHTKKYDVHVICPHSQDSKSFEIMDEVKVHRFKYFYPKFENLSKGISISNSIKENLLNSLLVPPFIFFGTLKILILLYKFRFKIVHNHWLIPFAPITSFFKKIFKYKLIITSHGGDILGFSKGLSEKIITILSKYSISRADHYTVVSTDMMRIAKKKFHLNSSPQIISMGIPYKEFSSVKTSFSEEEFTTVFIGRLSEMKGTRYLIEAIAFLQKNHNQKIKCKIIGDGPDRDFLTNLCIENNIDNLVEFLGFVPHKKVPEKLSNSSVFVGPSITTSSGYKEGFGLVFVEAMAAGLPVIASRSGGITDTVKHQKTGLLVEEKDYKQIAKYIIELRDNISLRNRLIRNGKKLAKKYAWENIAEEYSKLYEG